MSAEDGNDLAGSVSPDSPHSWRITKPYGTGVKRKQIEFVPASKEDQADGSQETGRNIDPSRGTSVADYYLSLVLPSKAAPDAGNSSELSLPNPEESKRRAENLDPSTETEGYGNTVPPGSAVVEQPLETSAALDQICPTCKARVTNWNSHVRTTAHMASEEHSKTPHHLNRQSEGYKHMVKLGWDPDGDRGLGAEGQGIRFPVKARMKKDNLGIGAIPLSKSIRDNAVNVSESSTKRQRLLTAKEMQRLEQAERAARHDLHDYLRH
ncbi:hypothetical protein TWF694_001274 [Orbilia ellipsospora]|uniref:G-patch domain-containing protein n=1 Tax=Orbilia ellipsospora TaxID=2528407 RepID=A0AAV9XSL9_9PEZI